MGKVLARLLGGLGWVWCLEKGAAGRLEKKTMNRVEHTPAPTLPSPLPDSGAQMWAEWLHDPCRLGGPQCSPRDKIKNGHLTPAVSEAQMWAEWLHNPCHLGGPQHSARGGPQCSTRGGNLKWPKCGPDGYITPALVDKEAI